MSVSVVINGVVYNAVPSVQIPRSDGNGNATFFETSSDSAVAGDILATKTAHGSSGAVTGSMTNNGAVTGTISTKDGVYNIASGYHNGSGSVGIASAEKSKIISSNIRGGCTILGVSGDSAIVNTSDADATTSQVLSGYTCYVNGSKLTGQLVVPTISQDGVTKVLTVS